MPNLSNRLTVSEGVAPGLGSYVSGQVFGSTSIDLLQQNLPVSSGGGTEQVSNEQPSLATQYIIRIDDVFGTDAGGAQGGEIVQFAGGRTPMGYFDCDGRALSISEYPALFATIGTTFGGDGVTTFNIPDLRGRSAVGTGGPTGVQLGQQLGSANAGITLANMPFEMGGSGQPVNNFGPSLGLNYLIRTQGIFPPRDDGSAPEDDYYLGEIIIYAGADVPPGFARCDGSVIPISQNPALFSLVGTFYGGNGSSTFALPNFSGRSAVGYNPGLNQVGQPDGSPTFTVTMADIPSLNIGGTSAAENLYGGNQADQINGNDGNDTLVGNGGNDTLNGGQGTDTLTGGTGNDTLNGGLGGDTARYSGNRSQYTVTRIDADSLTITGPDGTDTVNDVETFVFADGTFTFQDIAPPPVPTEGDDVLDGTENADTIDALGGNDTVNGLGGNDLLIGGAGNDALNGGEGDDVLRGGAGTDALNGGNGIDTADYSDSALAVTVYMQTFGGRVYEGAAITDTLTSIENVVGSSLGDLLEGNAGINILNGGEGNDRIRGGAGNDTLIGGNGVDELRYLEEQVNGGTQGVTVNLATGVAIDSYGDTDTLSGFENIAGTQLNDNLIGSDANNTLYGSDGNDIIDGGLGADVMFGNAGNDIVYVDSVSDVIGENVNDGTDEVRTTLATFTLGSNFENLTGLLSTGQTLSGNSVDNIITGGAGNDVLRGGGGADTLNGGAGLDTADYSTSTANETIFITGGGTTGDTFNSIENLTGGFGNDNLQGDSGANVLRGGAGDDRINGFGGTDTLIGGTGNDIYDLNSATDGSVTIVEDAGGGTNDQVFTTLASYTLAANVEILGGSSGGAQTLNGNDGNNFIYKVLAGAMISDGGAGNDFIRSFSNGAFEDVLSGGLGNDDLNGYAGADTLDGGDGDDSIVGGAGNDSLTGGSGIDTLGYSNEGGTLGVTVNLATGTATDSFGDTDTLSGFERAFGTNLADSLTGSANNDELRGFGGNDVIDGGAGNDQMFGGLGDDLYMVDSELDVVAEFTGEGTDTVNTTLASYTLAINVENLTGSLSTGQTLIGNIGNNVITAGAGADILRGGAGADVLNGGAGQDTADYSTSSTGVTIDLVANTASGGDAQGDTFSSIENIAGSGSADTLTGDANANVLNGGNGDDVLAGGAGDDGLAGGAGNDTARFSGNRSAYTVTQTGPSSLTIVGPDGTDMVTDVEFFTFADGTVPFASLIDSVAPVAPSAPDLDAASDTGVSNTDNITADDTPTVSGTAEVGSTVRIYDTDGVTVLGTGVADATTGAYSITLSTLSNGVHTLTATSTDASNNVSVASAALNVTIDTARPTISGFGPSVTFSENVVNAAPQLLDMDVSFSDAGAGVANGNLTLSGLLDEDRVSIQSSGLIAFDAATGVVSYDGIQIGTASGGVGTTFTVALNAAATVAGVDALIEHLTYANVSDTPTATRALTLNVTDTAGGQLLNPANFQPAGVSPFSGLVVPDTRATPSFGDVDGDGDLDLISGDNNGGALTFFRNGTNGTSGAYARDDAGNPFSGFTGIGNFSSGTLADVDNDGDLDVVIGSDNPQSLIYLRNGTTGTSGAFEQITGAENPFANIVVQRGVAAFADVDGDGDNDMVLGTAFNGLRYFVNGTNGSAGTFNEVTGAANPFNGLAAGQTSTAPTFGDVDGDGDNDLLVGTLGDGHGELLFFRNGTNGTSGTFAAPPVGQNEVAVVGQARRGDLADIDGDGDSDLVTGLQNGTFRYFVNGATGNRVITVNVTQSAPDAPTAPDLVAASDTGTSATDDVTNDTTPTLTGTAEPGAVVTVYDTDGITVLGTATADATTGAYAVTLTTLSQGVHALTVVATDAGGNRSLPSAALRVTIDTTAPDEPLLTGIDVDDGQPGDRITSDNTPTLNGTAEAFATVTILRDGVEVGTVTADADGVWAFNSDTLARGSYVFATQATDLAGNVGPTTTGNTVRVIDSDATPGDDQLQGTTDSDTIAAGDGNDEIDGLDGDDTLFGQGGDDTLRGGEGDDIVAGGSGNDTLDGGEGFDTADYSDASSGVRVQLNTGIALNDGDGGTDTLIGFENVTGSAFDDLLIGDADANTLDGGQARDVLIGGDGDDTLIGGSGAANELYGGSGDDTYILDANDTIVELAGGGTDTVRASINIVNLAANVENLVFTGTGVFRGNGNASDNTITGGAGDDILFGGAGSDTLNGGAGFDTADFSQASSGVVARLDSGLVSQDGDGGTDTLTSIEALVGSSFDDLLIGGLGDDLLDGGLGRDVLIGGAGNDLIRGGQGVPNELYGGEGDDTYILDANDTIVELAGGGIDTVRATINVVNLADNIENLIFTGTGGFIANGNAQDNVIVGGSGDDILSGGGGYDILIGGQGNDTLYGGSGAANEVYGGDGNDTYVLDADDTIIELAGGGTDTILANIAVVNLAGNVENLTFTGTGDFRGIGNALDNIITGGSGDDVLTGGGGNDDIRGGAGTDTLTLSGLAADYTVTAENGGYRIVDASGDRDGSTFVTSIERLSFADGAVRVLDYTSGAIPTHDEKGAVEGQIQPALSELDPGKAGSANPQVQPISSDDFFELKTDADGVGPQIQPEAFNGLSNLGAGDGSGFDFSPNGASGFTSDASSLWGLEADIQRALDDHAARMLDHHMAASNPWG